MDQKDLTDIQTTFDPLCTFFSIARETASKISVYLDTKKIINTCLQEDRSNFLYFI